MALPFYFPSCRKKESSGPYGGKLLITERGPYKSINQPCKLSG